MIFNPPAGIAIPKRYQPRRISCHRPRRGFVLRSWVCRNLAIAFLGALFALGIGSEHASGQDAGSSDFDQEDLRSVSPETIQAFCASPAGATIPECATFSTAQPAASPPGRRAEQSETKISAPVKDRQPSMTAFQRLVFGETGERLDYFGRDLYHIDDAARDVARKSIASGDYVLGPGDRIRLRVWGQAAMSHDLTVDESGSVFIPTVGAIAVASLRYDQIESTFRVALSRIYQNFELSVSMGSLRPLQVYLVGYLQQPGLYTLPATSTILDALFVAGGPSSEGSMRRVELKRSNRTVAVLDLYALIQEGDRAADQTLRSGDVVFVPRAGPRIAVAGNVHMPAIYELERESKLSEVLVLAGGATATADPRRAVLERFDPELGRESLDVALTGEVNLTARDGDILRVLPLPNRFRNVVTLRGSVATPGRFSWRPGMRLLDLIPNVESLVPPAYWRARNRLGTVTSASMDIAPAESRILADPGAGSDEAIERREQARRTEIEVFSPRINMAYAVVERVDPVTQKTSLIPFSPRALLLEAVPEANHALQAGDVITVFSQDDVRIPVLQQTRFIRLEGEVAAPGLYEIRESDTLRSVVARVGGLTPEAYLYGAQFFRESTRRQQAERLETYILDAEAGLQRNSLLSVTETSDAAAATLRQSQIEAQRAMLARLRETGATGRIVLRLDPAAARMEDIPDLVLEDGDRFFVPSRPATVNVVGSVYSQGAFLHDSVLMVKQYLDAAGDPTRNADRAKSFIIRADGTVQPQRAGMFGGGFDNLRLFPGDTIVVPEKQLRPSSWRAFREWALIGSQFALSGAAIAAVAR